MEILSPEQYEEFERFVRSHPQGSVTQSVLWHRVKAGWGHEVVVSRGEDGAIRGGMSILIRRFPVIGTALLYAPRGPVCDIHNEAVLRDLMTGADALAKQHRAHTFKVDPDILASDEQFPALARELGFVNFRGGDGFETIQARFNYRLHFEGRGEDEIFANLTSKTRYNTRLAMKKGVEVRVCGKEALPDFDRLMRTTGERDGFATRPIGYFETMLDALGEHCRLYMAYYEGTAVSGAIATNYGDKTCYLYGASDNAYRNVMSTFLIQWEMIRWALETGCTLYDFQGVSGDLSEDNPLYGLYRFKKGFNGTLEELPGEFDRHYRPFCARLADLAVSLVEWLRGLKRRLRGR